MSDLQEKFRDRGVVVLGAHGAKGEDEARAFAAENGAKHTIVLDDGSAASAYGVRVIPQTFIIDGKGRIRFHHVGFSPGDEEHLAEEVRSLLEG